MAASKKEQTFSGIICAMARPNLSYLKSLFLALAGLPCGALTGVTALAGSVLAAPVVRFLLGLRPTRLAATALATAFFAALGSLLAYQQHGGVRWGLAVLLAVGQIIGAGLGERIMAAWPRLSRLSMLWGLIVSLGGLAMLYYASDYSRVPILATFASPGSGVLFFVWAVAVALLVGVFSRVMELGGVLMVPAAEYLLHLPPIVAQGTALVVLMLAALPGLAIYAARRGIEVQSAGWMSFGALLGGLIGAYYAMQMRPALLVALYGIALIVLGLSLFFRKAPVEVSSPPAE